jgi:hypothetical protein
MLSLVRSPGRGLSCLRGLLLAFWYASLLACWPSGMPRFWPTGLLACLTSGLLAFWHASLLAFFGPSSGVLRVIFGPSSGFWHASLLAYWSSGMSHFWPVGLLACLASGLFAFWRASLLACWPSSGLLRASFGHCFWLLAFLVCLASGLLAFWHALLLLLAFLRFSGLPTVFWPSHGFRDSWPLWPLAFVSSGLWLLSVFWPVASLGLLLSASSYLSDCALLLSRPPGSRPSGLCVALSARQPYSVSFCSQKTTIFLSSRVWVFQLFFLFVG